MRRFWHGFGLSQEGRDHSATRQEIELAADACTDDYIGVGLKTFEMLWGEQNQRMDEK
jgi:hypothetical protein